MDEAGWAAAGLRPEAAALATRIMNVLEEAGLPLLDHIVGMRLEQPQDPMGQAKALLGQLKPGITHFIIHPSVDSPELRAITPDWEARDGNYRVFLTPELRDYVRSIGVQVIGYRALQALMPDPQVVAAALTQMPS